MGLGGERDDGERGRDALTSEKVMSRVSLSLPSTKLMSLTSMRSCSVSGSVAGAAGASPASASVYAPP